ncbi:cache domain-containing sensor histidine kinase [Gracilibacillus salinarum]|uniref:histidine kinase n=1 Tax=Gracilibacillus salinarum TaxID=2932255 RepID=A0ABY4GPK3_9BACI|nr:histidine kinase [Gracilibacillus salinarum]UOQ85267.1 sensor histidine kinase [Gracilibacillus salinarum]
MVKKVVQYYMDLRLKYKMVLLTSLVLLAFSVGGLSILQYAFHLYNKEIYLQSAQSLQVSANSVEAELKKMERLSYQISTDVYVQSYLKEIKDTDNSYNQFIIGMNLRQRVLNIGSLNKYVKSIQVYDIADKEYASGTAPITLSQERLDNLKQLAEEKEGGVNWVSPSDNDNTIMAVRDLRDFVEFSFARLGSVAVRVNIEGIMDDLTNNLKDQETSFLIYDNNGNQIFTNEDAINSIKPGDFNEGKSGYQIIDINGNKYFLTYAEASHLDWTYMIVTPYSNLFSVINNARTAVFITYLILFIIMIFLGSKFTGTIVNPIESLNQKMKKVQTGDLDYYDVGIDQNLNKDEAGQMHENFKTMMIQINYLIGENYKKQLLIKESEFKTLQAQVNPHFLYNTLDSINWSAKVVGEKRISQMAESLGYILRASINMKDDLISLRDELLVVDHYLTIQKYRFEDRLLFSKDIPDELLDVQIPKFIIQPIIENAIRYGLQEMVGVCSIHLSILHVDETLVIRLIDNGPGMSPSYVEQIKQGNYRSKGTGIGLRNINERVQLLFGEAYGLHIESTWGKGTEVAIILPKGDIKENVQSVISR